MGVRMTQKLDLLVLYTFTSPYAPPVLWGFPQFSFILWFSRNLVQQKLFIRHLYNIGGNKSLWETGLCKLSGGNGRNESYNVSPNDMTTEIVTFFKWTVLTTSSDRFQNFVAHENRLVITRGCEEKWFVVKLICRCFIVRLGQKLILPSRAITMRSQCWAKGILLG